MSPEQTYTFREYGVDYEVPFEKADRAPLMLKNARLRNLWLAHRYGEHGQPVDGCPPCAKKKAAS